MILSRNPEMHIDAGEMQRADLWTIYRQGLIPTFLNPKVRCSSWRFFRNSSPRIMHPSSAVPALGQRLYLHGNLWCLFVAFIAAAASKAFRSRARSIQIARRVTGMVFVGLGIRLALQDPK